MCTSGASQLASSSATSTHSGSELLDGGTYALSLIVVAVAVELVVCNALAVVLWVVVSAEYVSMIGLCRGEPYLQQEVAYTSEKVTDTVGEARLCAHSATAM